MSEWTYDGYWNTVIGAGRSADRLVAEFGLVGGRRGLDEWLGTAEAEAWSAGGLRGDLRDAWGRFHERALDEIERAIARASGNRAVGRGGRVENEYGLTFEEWLAAAGGSSRVQALIRAKRVATGTTARSA